MALVLVAWVMLNLVLFGTLFSYAFGLYRRSRSTSIGFVAVTLVLVSGTFLLASIQRLGIHAARAGLIPSLSEEFFLSSYQVVLSLVGTMAGIYAVTRLRAGIRRLEEGERMLDVLTDRVSVDADASEWGLTARELQVLDTIVSGRTSDEQIAETLFISPTTAATHVRNILRKAGMSNRMDLMLIGSRAGLPKRRSHSPDASSEPDLPASE